MFLIFFPFYFHFQEEYSDANYEITVFFFFQNFDIFW